MAQKSNRDVRKGSKHHVSSKRDQGTFSLSQAQSFPASHSERENFSGSRIPLYIPESKSTPNVSGISDQLPEMIRKNHEQTINGRHSQRPNSTIIEELIVATNSLDLASHTNERFSRGTQPFSIRKICSSSSFNQALFQTGSSQFHSGFSAGTSNSNAELFRKDNFNDISNGNDCKNGISNIDQNLRIRKNCHATSLREVKSKFRRTGEKKYGFVQNNVASNIAPEISACRMSSNEATNQLNGRRRNQRRARQVSNSSVSEPNGEDKNLKLPENHKKNIQNNRNQNAKQSIGNDKKIDDNGDGRLNRENLETTQRFTEYLPLHELQEALKKGEVVEGILRINPKNARDSYISASEESLDILINGYTDRNRALNGDKVAIKIHPINKWNVLYSILNAKWQEFQESFQKILSNKKFEDFQLESSKLNVGERKQIIKLLSTKTDLKTAVQNEFPFFPPEVLCLSISELCQIEGWRMFVQRTAHVVAITEWNHSRIAGGTLEIVKGSKDFYKCCSSDKKIPDIYIPKSKLPTNFVTTHNENQLFLVKIVQWNSYDYFPSGEIFDDLGLRGEIEAELQVILKSNDIETTEFPDNILDGTGFEAINWKIPQKELENRQDFRKHCLFTIDPSTAKDLDDAISLKDLGQGRYEVGVHIADVSYFIREGTLLDEIASRRATSVYLPDRVIPMLPHQFCQNLCSLNPGEDRLAFSTIFIMDKDGNVESHWIGRTVINSCSKLSYENAQKLIDDEKTDLKEFPQIFNEWNIEDLRKAIVILNNMAKTIRTKRFQTGSVRIDKSKLSFVLDDNQYPIGFAAYHLQDSNRLIEELMLLSNRTVAEHIYKRFSDEGRAFMRRHPPPDQNVLSKFKQQCSTLGLSFNTTLSLDIHKSLEMFQQKYKELFRWVSFQLIRAMKLAQYTTVSQKDSTLFFKHYALNFSYYTHFTSPIRRYADLIVHRLLCEDKHYEGACTKNKDILRDYAINCNKQKQNAFLVSEDAAKVFMKAHIRRLGTLKTIGIVCEVTEKSLEVLLVDFDIPVRVYIDKMPIDNVYYSKENGIPNLKIVWNKLNTDMSKEQLTQNFTVTTLVEVILSINEKFELHSVIPSIAKIENE